jgi:ankyrin repeat protein
MAAIKRGDMDTASALLIAASVDVRATGKDLNAAASADNAELAEQILLASRGMKLLNARTQNGATTLMYSSSNTRPSPNVLKYLLNKGADVTARDNHRMTALEVAQESGFEVMRHLDEQREAIHHRQEASKLPRRNSAGESTATSTTSRQSREKRYQRCHVCVARKHARGHEL